LLSLFFDHDAFTHHALYVLATSVSDSIFTGYIRRGSISTGT